MFDVSDVRIVVGSHENCDVRLVLEPTAVRKATYTITLDEKVAQEVLGSLQMFENTLASEAAIEAKKRKLQKGKVLRKPGRRNYD
jgi:hypothetical protein